jgi:hypothetical protein
LDVADSFLVGTWLSLVEHSLGVRGVGSSNLPVPTITPAISYQLSAFSFQLSAFSFQLSAFSYQLSAISYQLSAFR